jgi:hypothetical protein
MGAWVALRAGLEKCFASAGDRTPLQRKFVCLYFKDPSWTLRRRFILYFLKKETNIAVPKQEMGGTCGSDKKLAHILVGEPERKRALERLRCR